MFTPQSGEGRKTDPLLSLLTSFTPALPSLSSALLVCSSITLLLTYFLSAVELVLVI